jgi:DNA-binding SARP family transcriptional activator
MNAARQVELRTLGAIDLRDPTRGDLASVLAQPKRLAVLLALVLPGPDKFVRRDRLLAMFWPDLGTAKARHALRQTLYVLRADLGRDAIVSRGDEDVAIATGLVWCDAREMEALVAEKRLREALDLYAGELLPSFHVTDVASEFDEWVSAERARLRSMAATAAWSLVAECEAAGQDVEAVHWARRAVTIQPDDEAAIRRLLVLLRRLGDRLGALREYAALERRLQVEYSSSPSAETQALIASFQLETRAPPPAAPLEGSPRGEPVSASHDPISQELGQPGGHARSTVLPVRVPGWPKASVRQVPRVLGVAAVVATIAAGALMARSILRSADRPVPAASRASTPAPTVSPTARRLYDEGLGAQNRGDYRRAYRLFEAALREDTAFALAAYQASANLDSVPPHERAAQPSSAALLARAVRLAAYAPERDRLIITLRHVQPDRARYAAVAESLAARFPGEPAGYLALAKVRAAAGDFLTSIGHARRVLALDSLAGRYESICYACEAHHLIIRSYVAADSLATAAQAARELVRSQPASASAWSALAFVLARQRNTAEALAAHERAESLEPNAADDWMPARAALLADDYESASRYIASRPSADGRAAWWRVIVLRNQGRLNEALTAARELTAVNATLGRLAEAQVLFEIGRYEEAGRRFEAFAGAPPDADAGSHARHLSWLLTHAATAWARAGDTARLAALGDSVESIAHRSAYGRDWRLPAHIRGLLWQARGAPERAAASFRTAVYSPTEGFTRTNLELARTLLSLGRPNDAVLVIQSALRGSVDGSNFYVTRSELHEVLAQAFDAAKTPDSAAAHYALVAAAWSNADAPIRIRAEAARRRGEALRSRAEMTSDRRVRFSRSDGAPVGVRWVREGQR